MRHHPYYRLCVGVFLLLIWIAASAFTIITDEALIEDRDTSQVLSWEVLKQPYELVTGMYGAGIHMWAILGAWMIFSAYMLLSVLESIHHGKSIKSVLMILIGLDSIANYMYFHMLPWVFQMLMTLAIFMIVTNFLNLGIQLILGGFEEMGGGRP